MRITKNDVQERFTIAVPFAWVGNHIISTSIIPIGANIGVYGVNYRLYLFHYNTTNYHIVTGYRPNAYDIKYYDSDLKGYADKLDNIRADYAQNKISFEKAVELQDNVIYDLFSNSIKAVYE